MNKTIDERIIAKANADVNKLFSDHGLVFTEYRNRQAMKDLRAPAYEFDEEWGMCELITLAVEQLICPRKNIDINGITYEKAEKKEFMPTEVRTSGLRRKIVGSVFGSRPSDDLENVALCEIDAHPSISYSNYNKIQELCSSASEIYSRAFGKDWNITVNR